MENYIIVYDIVEDKRRNQIFKLLKEYATPVQYSVFQAKLNASNIITLEYKLRAVIDNKKDSLIIYKLCQSCIKKTKYLGNDFLIYGDDDIIV